MGTASTLLDNLVDTVETVFWHPITYAGKSVNAGISIDVIVESQDGITQADAVFKLKKTDFASSPPDTGDSVTVAVGVIGAGSYRIGQRLSESETTYSVLGTKIG